MCLLVFAWNKHPRYRVVLAANRDEFHARPAAAMHWWAEPDILGGRDLEAGGAWLAVGRDGRFGVVTNYTQRRTDAWRAHPGFLGWTPIGAAICRAPCAAA